MAALRENSPRKGLIVDRHANSVADPARTRVGRPAPSGRERVMFALPLSETPAQHLRFPTAFVSPHSALLGRLPTQEVIGRDRIWVPRMLTAGKVEDTRRFT